MVVVPVSVLIFLFVPSIFNNSETNHILFFSSSIRCTDTMFTLQTTMHSVDMDELNQLMQMLNMPVASGQMSQMMSEISSDEDGEISLEDFLRAMKAETTNPHTKHLLLRDFELFRPQNCPSGYIPRDKLLELLLTYAAGEDGHTSTEKATKEDVDSLHNTETTSSQNEKEKEEQILNNEDSVGDIWTKSGIRDLIQNIPLDCFHKKSKNLINFNKLITTMLGEDMLDPFQEEEK